jgi:hypothetical protein
MKTRFLAFPAMNLVGRKPPAEPIHRLEIAIRKGK